METTFDLTPSGVRSLLERMATDAGNIHKLATKLDVNYPYLCEVIRGVKRPGPSILRALGLEEITFYRRVSP